MRIDESDCIAMSEDGFSWFAFPKWMPRSRVMAGLASSSEICGGDWHWFLTHYRIRAGRVTEEPRGSGWWRQCPADSPEAEPAWIVTQRSEASPGRSRTPLKEH